MAIAEVNFDRPIRGHSQVGVAGRRESSALSELQKEAPGARGFRFLRSSRRLRHWLVRTEQGGRSGSGVRVRNTRGCVSLALLTRAQKQADQQHEQDDYHEHSEYRRDAPFRPSAARSASDGHPRGRAIVDDVRDVHVGVVLGWFLLFHRSNRVQVQEDDDRDVEGRVGEENAQKLAAGASEAYRRFLVDSHHGPSILPLGRRAIA